MSIVQKMRSQLAETMKARDTVRLNFLRYWIAQLTLGTGAEMSEADAIKKMRGVLKEAKSGVTTFTAEEIALLSEWVPALLTPEQIKEALAPVAEQIKAAPKEGMAMGIAMKSLAGQQVDSDDVKAAMPLARQGSLDPWLEIPVPTKRGPSMTTPGARLRAAWSAGPIMIPGAFNALVAKLAERLGLQGRLSLRGSTFGGLGRPARYRAY